MQPFHRNKGIISVIDIKHIYPYVILAPVASDAISNKFYASKLTFAAFVISLLDCVRLPWYLSLKDIDKLCFGIQVKSNMSLLYQLISLLIVITDFLRTVTNDVGDWWLHQNAERLHLLRLSIIIIIVIAMLFLSSGAKISAVLHGTIWNMCFSLNR